MVSALTEKWLAENTTNYSDPNLVMAQVVDVLNKYLNLRPKLDVYTYDDGRSQLLLCVHGLLPIQFRGATYNIPVALWLPILYPRHVPIAYVVPTADMLVKAGKYVEVSGRCEVEYMKMWERKFEGCSLVGLAEAMQEQFSKESPLYAKPKSKPTSTSAPSAQAGLTTINPNLGNRPPPPIPAPSPPTQLETQQPRASIPSTSQDLATRPPPPLPRPNRPPSYIPPPHYHPSPAQDQSTPPHQYPGPPPIHAPPPLPPTFHAGPSPPPPPPPPPSLPAPAVPLAPPPKPVIRNILDEAEEPSVSTPPTSASSPPPRPLNPHLLALHQTIHNRIHSSLQTLSNSHEQAARVLMGQRGDLLAGEPAIRDEMARLEAVGEICRSSATKMKDVISEAEGKIAELQRRMGPDGQGPTVDELVCGTSIVHNQLIELVAEDNAIEDTIYHLHRALSNGRLDLERFLRTTRVLAEEQFMKRALIERIHTSLKI